MTGETDALVDVHDEGLRERRAEGHFVGLEVGEGGRCLEEEPSRAVKADDGDVGEPEQSEDRNERGGTTAGAEHHLDAAAAEVPESGDGGGVNGSVGLENRSVQVEPDSYELSLGCGSCRGGGSGLSGF